MRSELTVLRSERAGSAGPTVGLPPGRGPWGGPALPTLMLQLNVWPKLPRVVVPADAERDSVGGFVALAPSIS